METSLRKPNYVPRRVGGRLPDRWIDYRPMSRLLKIPNTRLLILPCKAFLDPQFDTALKAVSENRQQHNNDSEINSESVDPWNVHQLLEKVQNGEVVNGVKGKRCQVEEPAETAFVSDSDAAGVAVAADSDETHDGSKEVEPELAINVSGLGAVVNLCMTERYYNPHTIREQGIEYYWFKISGGGEIPSVECRSQFIQLMRFLECKHPDSVVALHCTHGINRTGFFTTLAMMVMGGVPFRSSVGLFAAARGYPINRQELIEALATADAHNSLVELSLESSPTRSFSRSQNEDDDAPIDNNRFVLFAGPFPAEVFVEDVVLHLVFSRPAAPWISILSVEAADIEDCVSGVSSVENNPLLDLSPSAINSSDQNKIGVRLAEGEWIARVCVESCEAVDSLILKDGRKLAGKGCCSISIKGSLSDFCRISKEDNSSETARNCDLSSRSRKWCNFSLVNSDTPLHSPRHADDLGDAFYSNHKYQHSNTQFHERDHPRQHKSLSRHPFTRQYYEMDARPYGPLPRQNNEGDSRQYGPLPRQNYARDSRQHGPFSRQFRERDSRHPLARQYYYEGDSRQHASRQDCGWDSRNKFRRRQFRITEQQHHEASSYGQQQQQNEQQNWHRAAWPIIYFPQVPCRVTTVFEDEPRNNRT